MKKLKVDAIKAGTVIDHIPAGTALRLIEILGISENDQFMIGTHLVSHKFGKKDIVKVEGREFSEEDLNIAALIAPAASFSTIRDFKTVRKHQVQIPTEIRRFLNCPNPTCITNNENIHSHFYVESTSPIAVRCNYCERIYTIDNMNKFMKKITE
jgi:aspartate carbamoyltransferase regulatory subunit